MLVMAAGSNTQAEAVDKRDQIIAEYYAHNPRDADFYRWKAGPKWTENEYMKWYSTRTLSFQSQPGISDIFGVDRTGNKMPGFVMN
jgi:hypothetical protein